MNKKISKKTNKKIKKVRKKRRTYTFGYEEGYNIGYDICKCYLINYTLDIIDKMIEEYNDDIQHYPRNTKFVELQMDAITEMRDRYIYDDSVIDFNEFVSLEKNRRRQTL